jgi:hypothetical protein
VDIRRGEDLGRFREGDPVRRRRHLGQSVDFAVSDPADVDAAGVADPVSFAPETGAGSELVLEPFASEVDVASPLDFDAPGVLVARRSFLAQPEPL